MGNTLTRSDPIESYTPCDVTSSRPRKTSIRFLSPLEEEKKSLNSYIMIHCNLDVNFEFWNKIGGKNFISVVMELHQLISTNVNEFFFFLQSYDGLLKTRKSTSEICEAGISTASAADKRRHTVCELSSLLCSFAENLFKLIQEPSILA